MSYELARKIVELEQKIDLHEELILELMKKNFPERFKEEKKDKIIKEV